MLSPHHELKEKKAALIAVSEEKDLDNENAVQIPNCIPLLRIQLSFFPCCVCVFFFFAAALLPFFSFAPFFIYALAML